MSRKFYSMHSTVTDANGDDHVVLVVGEFINKKEQHLVAENVNVQFDDRHQNDGFLITSFPHKVRRFKMAYAICHPNDEFDEEVGIAIAKSRLKRNPIGELCSTDVTMLNEDMCNMLLFTEMQHIKNNIASYI